MIMLFLGKNKISILVLKIIYGKKTRQAFSQLHQAFMNLSVDYIAISTDPTLMY